MKLTFCILSVVAAVASAAMDATNQTECYQTYTAPSFPIPAVDINFRDLGNKESYYQSLKTFNNLITPKEFPESALPFAVVKPSQTNNRGIARVIQTAKAFGLRVSARSGGYQSGYSSNMAAIDNNGQDFVLIDLSKLNKVTINPKARTATVEPGATGLELYTETI
ncbi:hypothetical protein CPB97_005090, partial [Podila verticillata]